ncbi:MAG TPA: glycosyltransferase family 2 protein [Anaerolineae bacterium]|nr:glycosyltransferase family 2 protein [Anaerolineae bacterium]
MNLSVIVPVFNEEKTVGSVIESILQYNPNIHEILVVDDGSTDGTRNIVNKYSKKYKSVKSIFHKINLGKTAALITGFKKTTGNVILIQDADLEYDPSEIHALIEPIQEEKADVVYGSRFLVRKTARVLYFRHFMANKFITFLSNIFTDFNFTDVETGYKAFRSEIINNMIITSKGFGFEIEVTAKLAKLKCRVYEVPISYYGRTYEEGKKIGLSDGLLAIYYIVKYNLFTSLKKSFYKMPEM